MASDNDKKLNTVSQAAYSALMDIGEDESRYEQFLHWSIEGAQDWHMDMAKEIKTIECDLTPYKAIDFPDDYLDWTKIGIRCGDIIKTFVHDENISLEFDCIDGEKQANTECEPIDSLDVFPGWGYAYTNYSTLNGEDPGRLYGVAAQDNGLGYFRIHREARQFQFRGLTPSTSTIYLEYLSTGWDPCKETYLNPYAFKLVKMYVNWMNLLHNHTKPRILSQEAERLYWNEFERVKYRMFELTLEDILEVSREAYVASPQT